MKGVVFTEFLDFVGAQYGSDMVDDIIEDAAPPNGGAYTAVGTYPHTEMGALVGALATRTGTGAPDLLTCFGSRLCLRFAEKFPEFFAAANGLFDFLASVENHIHVEVRKLYPDAELPRFCLSLREDHAVHLDYESCRPLEALAEGMILAAAEHYGEPVVLTKARVAEPERSFVRFVVRRAARRLAA